MLFWKVVPGGGFEPPTRGFSVHCSTPELPGHGRFDNLGEGLLGRADQSVQRDSPIFAVFGLRLKAFQKARANVPAQPAGFPNLDPCTDGFL